MTTRAAAVWKPDGRRTVQSPDLLGQRAGEGLVKLEAMSSINIDELTTHTGPQSGLHGGFHSTKHVESARSIEVV